MSLPSACPAASPPGWLAAVSGALRSRALPAVCSVAVLSACAVGPDYRRPAMAPLTRYTETALAGSTQSEPVPGGGSQSTVVGGDIPGEWWALFRSPAITALVRAALAQNPNVASAQASLRQARELRLQQEGTLFPDITGVLAHARQEEPLSFEGVRTPSLLFSDVDAQLNLSYTIDVWGGLRRAVEAAGAHVDYQRYELEAIDLALSAGVATSAVTAASLAAQIKVQQDLIGFEQRQLQTVRRQFELGGATGTDVATQEAQVATAQTVLVPLQTQLAQTRDQLAAYLGRAPSEVSIPALDLDAIVLPDMLPVSVPSSLLDQRPDIRAAEATLHQESADLGVAISNRLPQVTLTASVGSQSPDFHQLFSPTNGLWSLVNQAAQPIFDAGQLLHAQRAQRAALDAAGYAWRNTVVTAYQNVADVLVALQNDALSLRASVDAERASARSLSLASLQYKLGGVSYLSVLTAQQSYQNASLSLLRARALRYTDTIALFPALGGGWWHRSDVPPPPPGLLISPLP